MRVVRHCDQEERKTDGANHWNTVNPELLRAYGDKGARKFSWLQHIFEGSNITRFEYCENSQKFLDVYSCNSRTHWWEYDSA